MPVNCMGVKHVPNPHYALKKRKYLESSLMKKYDKKLTAPHNFTDLPLCLLFLKWVLHPVYVS